MANLCAFDSNQCDSCRDCALEATRTRARRFAPINVLIAQGFICACIRIICSPAKQGYTARAPTLRPTRHPGAYHINQNHRTCEEKYDYASAAAAIKRDTPGND